MTSIRRTEAAVCNYSLYGLLAVWGCSYHTCGSFLATCSMDKTAKLWDLGRWVCFLTIKLFMTISLQLFSNKCLSDLSWIFLCLINYNKRRHPHYRHHHHHHKHILPYNNTQSYSVVKD